MGPGGAAGPKGGLRGTQNKVEFALPARHRGAPRSEFGARSSVRRQSLVVSKDFNRLLVEKLSRKLNELLVSR